MRRGHDKTRQMYLADAYVTMKEVTIQAGFAWEIDWQESRSLSRVTESEFLAESAWVILSSGMRASIVRRFYPEISQAFMDWPSARTIADNRSRCEENALRMFRHGPKIRAIGSLCEKVAEGGFDWVLEGIKTEGVSFLRTFDFIGPVTSFHLAKNVGLDIVKPDRHLTRMAEAAGFSSPEALCAAIAEVIGDRLSVIDVVLWRYATLEAQYSELIRSCRAGAPPVER
jgi:hypothetical protein